MEPTETAAFSATLRDHATYPRNVGVLRQFNGHSRVTGPCGDTMEFWLNIQDNRVANISFFTNGCGSSLACGSMATVLVTGRHVKEAAVLGQQDILHALGGLPSELEHCALLAAETLNAACEEFFRRQARMET